MDVEMVTVTSKGLDNEMMDSIASASNRESRSCKIAKALGLLAIPIIAGTVSLVTRLELCKDMSSDECAEEYTYLNPVEMVGGVYTAGTLVVGLSKCICRNMFS